MLTVLTRIGGMLPIINDGCFLIWRGKSLNLFTVRPETGVTTYTLGLSVWPGLPKYTSSYQNIFLGRLMFLYYETYSTASSHGVLQDLCLTTFLSEASYI